MSDISAVSQFTSVGCVSGDCIIADCVLVEFITWFRFSELMKSTTAVAHSMVANETDARVIRTSSE